MGQETKCIKFGVRPLDQGKPRSSICFTFMFLYSFKIIYGTFFSSRHCRSAVSVFLVQYNKLDLSPKSAAKCFFF